MKALLISVAVAISMLMSQETFGSTNEVSSPTFSLESSIRSEFVSFRTSREVTTTPVILNDLNLFLPHDLRLNVWQSQTTSSAKSECNGNELDLALGKNWKFNGFSVYTEYRFMNLNQLNNWGDGDVMSFTLSLSSKPYKITTNQTIQGVLYTEYLCDLKDLMHWVPTVQPGLVYVWKAPLGIKCLSVCDKNWIAWDDGWRKNTPNGMMLRIDANCTWDVMPHVQVIVPGVRFVTIMVNPHDGRHEATQWWAGVKLSF